MIETKKQAVEYLRPIAESAVLPKYQQALKIAIRSMEDGAKCGGSCRCHQTGPKALPTRSDHIRAMDDRGLAGLLCRMYYNEIDFCRCLEACDKLLETEEEIPEEHCADCLLHWLRQPAEEGCE